MISDFIFPLNLRNLFFLQLRTLHSQDFLTPTIMSAPRTPKAPQMPTGQGEMPTKTPTSLKKKRVPTNGDINSVEKSAPKPSPKPLPQQDDAPSPGSPIRKKKRIPKPAADVAPPTQSDAMAQPVALNSAVRTYVSINAMCSNRVCGGHIII